MRRLEAIIAELGRPLPALEQPVEEAIVALALEVARCVVGDEVRRSHEFLARLVREAIAKVPLEMGIPRVLLNPADFELIRKLVPEIEPASAMLLADETIDAGGCLVIADGEGQPIKDRRWNPRAAEGVSQVDLTLSSRWRAVWPCSTARTDDTPRHFAICPAAGGRARTVPDATTING
jgi:hypothetical protein